MKAADVAPYCRSYSMIGIFGFTWDMVENGWLKERLTDYSIEWVGE